VCDLSEFTFPLSLGQVGFILSLGTIDGNNLSSILCRRKVLHVASQDKGSSDTELFGLDLDESTCVDQFPLGKHVHHKRFGSFTKSIDGISHESNEKGFRVIDSENLSHGVRIGILGIDKGRDGQHEVSRRRVNSFRMIVPVCDLVSLLPEGHVLLAPLVGDARRH